MVQAITCPQCGGPLSPHRFARSIVCPFCGATVRLDETAISAARFHETFRIWNSPETYGFAECISIGSRHWALDRRIAHGDSADVYLGRRARWPSTCSRSPPPSMSCTGGCRLPSAPGAFSWPASCSSRSGPAPLAS